MTDLQALHDSTHTMVMGVLNITEDSSSDGGLWLDPAKAAQHGRDMMAAGADIIDIGAESTRPGAKRVAEADELARIACMGQTKLRRTFKQACGCTIVEYRQRLRCAKAAELLAAGDAPVAQVAAAVGYRPERLAELFARTHHTTPSAYRAAMR